MPKLIVTDWSGKVHEIEGRPGNSVMEAIRQAGIDDVAALCGGSCSCATCHVYVDDAWIDRLPAQEDNERDLLDSLDTKRDNSRLSCQITIGEAIDGIVLTVAPEE